MLLGVSKRVGGEYEDVRRRHVKWWIFCLSPSSCPVWLVNLSSQAPGFSRRLVHQKRAGGLICPLASPGEWKSVHLDDLVPPENFKANLGQLSKMTIAEIFLSSSQRVPTGKKPLTRNPPSPLCCPFLKPTAPPAGVPPMEKSAPGLSRSQAVGPRSARCF